MSARHLRSLLLGVAVLCPALASAQAEAPVPVVSGIEIKGASDPTVVRYLSVKVGEPLDGEKLRASVLLLSAMDIFDDVSVEQERESSGATRLTFHVVETPRVGELIFVTPMNGAGPDVPADSSIAKALSAQTARSG